MKRWDEMVMINDRAPDFTADAYIGDEIKKVSLSEYKGRWLVLFFYPADFTFVCPTELGELADNYDTFRKLGADILSVSTDTAFVHKAWHDNSETIRRVRFPMLADPGGKVSRAYGAYDEEHGHAVRATFVIDPEGKIKAFEFHDNGIGRSVEELLRKLQAAQFTATHGVVCPASWKPGGKTLKPGLDLVGKI